MMLPGMTYSPGQEEVVVSSGRVPGTEENREQVTWYLSEVPRFETCHCEKEQNKPPVFLAPRCFGSVFFDGSLYAPCALTDAFLRPSTARFAESTAHRNTAEGRAHASIPGTTDAAALRGCRKSVGRIGLLVLTSTAQEAKKLALLWKL